MVPPCVRMLVCFPTDSLARQSASWYRSECHPNQSPVEQRGDGIPPQAAINPTWRDTSVISSVAFIPFQGHCKERLSFFSTCIVTVNPHDIESANFSGKLRRKGR